MPKARSRKRAARAQGAKIDWGGPAGKGTGRLNVALAAIAVLAVVAAGVFWWRNTQTENEFFALAAKGRSALARVETLPNDGQSHLQPGERHKYAAEFPTSGPHDPVPTDPGFYDQPQRATRIVHALEHGHIVIYYDDPGADVLDRLKDWAALYDGHWDGVIATPFSGLGRDVVLTAWRKVLELDGFDPAAAAAFIDEYRGRGPENPVR
ncbi:MAG: DUF3105 domain-containing protein [Kiloniellaceae bacterium]